MKILILLSPLLQIVRRHYILPENRTILSPFTLISLMWSKLSFLILLVIKFELKADLRSN